MLQQTTVATVIPYFGRFIKKWPTVGALANAQLEDVLHAWQGLGYYRRARHLHAAAQIIAKDGWPRSAKELQNLSGIGAYTSRAIAAIAWGESTLPIDGNIARIMARVLSLRGLKSNVTKQLERYDWGDIPEPGRVAQALMDLGQAICTPRQPACDQCPMQPQCASPGIQPFDDIKPIKRQLFAQAMCVTDEHGTLVCEEANASAPSKDLLEGLWTPIMTTWRAEPYDKKTDDCLAYCGSLTHVFSHIRLTVDVYKGPQEHINLPHRPFSRLARKIIEKAFL